MPPIQKPKKATFASQLKGLDTTTGTKNAVSVPFNKRDPDIALYLSFIQAALKKKHGETWTASYKNKMDKIIVGAKNSTNALDYLQKVLKIIDPAVKPGVVKKLKPGQMSAMATPNIALSPTAQQFVVTGDSAIKAAKLEAKIKEYTNEIKRLTDAANLAKAAQSKAQQEIKKFKGIDPKLLKYFTYIEKNCGEALKSIKEAQKLIFRGQDDASHPVFVGYPRSDRVPKDSNLEAQKLLDTYLSTMGFKALRSNSIFTTSDMNQAGDFGDLYAIFPKDGFNFTWSPTVSDLVLTSVSDVDDSSDDTEDLYYGYDEWVDDINRDAYDAVDAINNYNAPHNEIEKRAKIIRKSADYKSFQKAIQSWADIDIEDNLAYINNAFIKIVNLYIVLSKQFPEYNRLLSASQKKKILATAKKASATKSKDIKTKAAKSIKQFGFIHTDLTSAIKSGNEICILGEYVAVNFEMYERELKEYFLTKKAPPKKSIGIAKVPKPKKI